jgi:hypothetical protein
MVIEQEMGRRITVICNDTSCDKYVARKRIMNISGKRLKRLV